MREHQYVTVMPLSDEYGVGEDLFDGVGVPVGGYVEAVVIP